MIYLNANNSMDIFHSRPGIMIDNELKKATELPPNGCSDIIRLVTEENLGPGV